ncbi:MAG: hypothetical protein FWB88_08250 [Defluviitaleaceae bacterium]|nr:hypothetical protein [Defluviitaleaceae bacterium]MCL2239492.1 hypothetical protein [Defluviitaleaceae bacterium]
MKALNEKYEQILRERYEENLAGGKAAVHYMENSTAICRGIPVACGYIPKLFSPKAWARLNQAAQTIYAILDKVIRRYLEDAEYRKLFPFPAELEELILTEAGYPQLLPIARLDIFFNEADFSFQFCEFNADGSSAMNENRELDIALRHCDAMEKMRETHEITSYELFDSWAREFMDIYRTYNKKIDAPRIAITDFMEKGTPNEFIQFKLAFERAGYETEICDIRDLTYSNGKLNSPCAKQIHAIYRRAVTRDIMENKDDVRPFLQAVRDNAVCLIGHLRTQIIHNKSIFHILRRAETFAFLTPEEREYVLRHIPETLPLTGDVPPGVLENKNDWIIKPEDFYGSQGVYVGLDMDEAEWRKAVSEATDTGYILQRFCPPYKTYNLNFNQSDRPDFELYNNITGMFIYNGKLQGLYSRIGKMGKISAPTGVLTVASLACNTP